MTTEDQKRIWQEEKLQQQRDKQAKGVEVKQRKVNLRMACSAKKQEPKPTQTPLPKASGSLQADDILRRQLGI